MAKKKTVRKINPVILAPFMGWAALSVSPVFAQDATQPPAAQPPATQPPGTQPPAVSPATTPPLATMPPATPFTQPTAKTPPTPLPKNAPNTDVYGTKKSDVKPVGVFAKQVPGQPQTGDPTTIRTLDEAIAVALRRNPNILSAQERAVRTVHIVRQIVGGNGPQFSLSGSYNRLSGLGAAAGAGGLAPGNVANPFPVGLTATPPGSVPVTLTGAAANNAQAGQTSATGAADAGTTGAAGQTRAESTDSKSGEQTRQVNQGGGGNFNNAAKLNQTAVRAQVTQFIDITGVFRAAVQLGDLEEALSRLEIQRQRQDVAYNVRTAYYNVLRSQAFVQVNQAAVAQSEELVRVTQAQQAAGVASEYDVLRARTQLENNRQALIAARNQVSISRNAFANTIGIDPSTPVEPEMPAIPPLPDLNEQALVDKAIKQRPEYGQADLNILVANKNIRLARRTLEPYLNAVASGGYNPDPTAGVDKSTGAIGLTLSIPLWDGGSTREAVEAARSDQRSALITKDQYVRGIKAEVQQAIIAILDANERAQATQLTVTEATEALRLANVRYRAGVDTQLSVNDAQTALIQAQTNAVNAQFDYLAALARLSRAVGNPE